MGIKGIPPVASIPRNNGRRFRQRVGTPGAKTLIEKAVEQNAQFWTIELNQILSEFEPTVLSADLQDMAKRLGIRKE